MEAQSICDPQLAEADTVNNVVPHNNLASSSDADTVINTNNTNSSQNQGLLGEGELLKGLLTDEYCHVCEAVLLFESQKISHYEGRKHAHKLRLYLQTKKDEKLWWASGIQDRERYCELCGMVFSSPVVARQHYEGKVHAKNLRKQGLHPTAQSTVTAQGGPELTLPGPATNDQKTTEEDGGKGPPPQDSLEVDLNDPNKHCRLCAASFNNPHMAQQHYSGRKHQRNHSRQQLLRDLGEQAQQANSYTCPVCNVKLNSVEMFQAHMQGNKHQTKEKKVVDLCKSQQKVYDNFADELADYVQVQKARGLAPKTAVGICDGDGQKERKEEEEEGGGGVDRGHGDGTKVNQVVPHLPPSSHPPRHHPYAAAFYPPPAWRPPYPAGPAPFGFRGFTLYPHAPAQPLLPGTTASPGFVDWSTTRAWGSGMGRGRGRGKDHPSPSSSSSSSYTSSTSNSSSSSDSSDRRERRRRRRRKSRRERERRIEREEEDDEEDRRRSKGGGKRTRGDNSEGRRGREDEDPEVEEERRRRMKRKRPSQSKRQGEEGHRAKRSRVEEEEEVEGRRVGKEESTEGRVGKGEETTEVHMQAEMREECEEEREQAKQSKPKHRKEKKRTKDKVDTRTEEEKLWDESLGL